MDGRPDAVLEVEPLTGAAKHLRRGGAARYQLVDERQQLRFSNPKAAPLAQAVAELGRGRSEVQTVLRREAERLDQGFLGFLVFDSEDRLVLCNGRYRAYFSDIADLLVPGRSFAEIAAAVAERANQAPKPIRLDGWVREHSRAEPDPSPSQDWRDEVRWALEGLTAALTTKDPDRSTARQLLAVLSRMVEEGATH